MAKKNSWLLTLALGVSSATILVDRLVIHIPNWLAIIFAVIAIIAFILFFVSNRKFKK